MSGPGTSPPLTRREQIAAEKSGMSSPNSSFNGSSNLSASSSANASFSGGGIERVGSSKKSKEDAKRDKEEERVRKKDMKKEKERAKMSLSLGLSDGEKILHEFSCAIKKGVLLTGRLYVTPAHLVFKYSLGSSQETIAVKEIIDIRKELTYFIPNAIVIRADKEYFLGSFLHRDQAWAILNIIISNAKSEKPMDVEALHKATKQAKHQVPAQNDSLPDGVAADIDLGPEDEFTQKMFGSAPEANAPLPADGSVFREPSAKTPVVDAVFPVGLKTTWRLFLADPSTFSMEIHTFVKDFDIKVGPWTVDASKAFYTRTLTFQTPIQSRLVRRNSCDVRMVQKLVLRSPHELWLDTSNFISGTPYAEDFTVEAKWRFTSDEADKTTHLVVFLEMNWTKTPMAITKNMIDKASLGGAGAMVESWVRLAKQKIQRMSGAKEVEAEAMVPVAGSTEGTSPHKLMSSRAVKIFTIVWLVVLLLMVLYMNAKISALASRIKDLERLVVETQKLRQQHPPQ